MVQSPGVISLLCFEEATPAIEIAKMRTTYLCQPCRLILMRRSADRPAVARATTHSLNCSLTFPRVPGNTPAKDKCYHRLARGNSFRQHGFAVTGHDEDIRCRHISQIPDFPCPSVANGARSSICPAPPRAPRLAVSPVLRLVTACTVPPADTARHGLPGPNVAASSSKLQKEDAPDQQHDVWPGSVTEQVGPSGRCLGQPTWSPIGFTGATTSIRRTCGIRAKCARK